jgi:hypothetical protein
MHRTAEASLLFLRSAGLARFKVLARWALAWQVIFAAELFANDNEVLIIGRPRESKTQIHTGRSVSIHPRESSGFEANSHLRTQSSMQLQETGSTSASGFTLPRIRGHDYRLTRTSIDDVTIYDPDLNLPTAVEIDLRAFGQMNLDYGVPGIGTSGVTPVGGINFEYSPTDQPSTSLGAKLGDVYGQSYFINMIRPRTDQFAKPDSEVRVFARRHVTQGNFAYYSDESTPYNSGDDRIRSRINNESQSLQIIPTASVATDLGRFRLVSLVDSSERGLASSSAVVESKARERIDSQTIALGYSRPQLNPDTSKSVTTKLTLLLQSQNRRLNDPSSYYILLGQRSSSALRSWQINGSRHYEHDDMLIGLEAAAGEAMMDRSIDQTRQPQLMRNHSHLELSGAWKPKQWTLGAKANWKLIDDTSTRGTDQLNVQRPEARTRWLGSQALLGNYTQGPAKFYVQIAHSKRAPSLAEEFGDGSTVLQSEGLESETIIHAEAGASIRSFSNRLLWVFGLFQDRVNNKISLIPALANSLRATNLRHAEISGLELTQQLRIGAIDWQLNYTRLIPIDTTTSARRILPATPQWQAGTDISWRYKNACIKWISVGRGKVFRDANQQIEIPAQVQSDLHLDYLWDRAENDYRIGSAIHNLANLRSAAISSGNSGNQTGRTALSDFAGAPLPGRSLIVYLEADMSRFY